MDSTFFSRTSKAQKGSVPGQQRGKKKSRAEPYEKAEGGRGNPTATSFAKRNMIAMRSGESLATTPE